MCIRDRGEVSDFVNAIFKEFDKLGPMSALYVDMSGLLAFIEELKPRCGCTPAHFCSVDNLHYPAEYCKYHIGQELMDYEVCPKKAQELNEKYRQMVWDMEAEDQHQAWLQGRSEHPDDDESFIDSAGFDSNGINHFQEKLNQHPDDEELPF